MEKSFLIKTYPECLLCLLSVKEEEIWKFSLFTIAVITFILKSSNFLILILLLVKIQREYSIFLLIKIFHCDPNPKSEKWIAVRSNEWRKCIHAVTKTTFEIFAESSPTRCDRCHFSVTISRFMTIRKFWIPFNPTRWRRFVHARKLKRMRFM